MTDHITRRNIEYLDRHIPLRGVSHADVRHYSVDIPLRYAECRAELVDSGVARLLDKRQFLGRSSHARDAALLFACSQGLVVLRTASAPAEKTRFWRREKFVGVDGELLEIGRWRVMELELAAGDRHIPDFQRGLAIQAPTLMRSHG